MAAGFKTATVASGDVPATLTNYPTYVDLSRLGITTLAEAQSVRVYADSGKTTEWAREIVSATEMHVKVPSLTSTTSIYVDWDGSSADYAATDTYGRNAVWADYELVLHFEDNVTDSAGNHSPTASGLSYVTDKIGKGANFEDTTPSTIDLGSGISIASGVDRSFTFWFKRDRATPIVDEFLFNSATPLYIISSSHNEVGASYNMGFFDGAWKEYGAYDFTSTSKYAGFVFSGTTSNLYLDGAFQADEPYTQKAISGAAELGSYYVDNTRAIDGIMDEFRLRASALSADWITTEYNNQSDEAGFWGTWTDAGGGGGDTTKFFNLMS